MITFAMGDLENYGSAIKFAIHHAIGPVSIGMNSYAFGGGVKKHRHHDFAEIFWVVRGRIKYHWNGHDGTIAPGHLQFVRREDTHYLEALDVSGALLVNLGIHQPLLTKWQRQGVFGGTWPWADTTPLHLDHRDLSQLQTAVASMPLEPSPIDHLWLVAGVVRIAQEVRARRRLHPCGSAEPPPDWLTRALRDWRDGEPEADVRALARRAGRSREHLARTIRRHYGSSPSTLLNHLRCDRAAADLRATEIPVLTIAMSCGFSGLGQFYRCFQSRFGCAPRRYREGFRGV